MISEKAADIIIADTNGAGNPNLAPSALLNVSAALATFCPSTCACTALQALTVSALALAPIIQPIANELRHDTDVYIRCQQSRRRFLLGGWPTQSTSVLECGRVTCRQVWPLWRSW
jgi:hypothetical protein